MLTDLGIPLLPRIERAAVGFLRYVRRWQATLEGDCWCQIEAAGADPATGCAHAAAA